MFAQTDTHVMGVARQAPASTTGGLMFELKAKRQDEGEDTFEERLPIAKQPEIRRFAPEINGDGAVFSRRFGCSPHVSPPGHQVSHAHETQCGEHIEISRPSCRV